MQRLYQTRKFQIAFLTSMETKFMQTGDDCPPIAARLLKEEKNQLTIWVTPRKLNSSAR